MRPKKAERRFYHVCTSNREDWATELELLSPKRASKCYSCGKSTGLFLREVSHTFNVSNRLNVRTTHGSDAQCKECWISGSNGPVVRVNKGGQTEYPYLETIIFAKDLSELAELVRRWKGGLRFNCEIDTPWGMVPVVGPDEQEDERQTAKITCPNCKISIGLAVTAERHC